MSSVITRVALIGLSSQLIACDRLTRVPVDPPTSPEQWLVQRPYWRIGSGDNALIITEPSSSLLIYGLALLAAWIGYRVWQQREGSPAHWWFGLGMLLWGLQAALAGTHYQAFSYEVRCAGRELCALFSWWEIGYYLVTLLNINALVVAVAHTSASGRLRRTMALYAAASTIAYFVLCLTGAFIPNAFLVSFELMVLFTTPTWVMLFAVNLRSYRLHTRLLDLRMMQAWVLLFVVTAGYFVYLAAGIGEWLWARGIWFNANDFLHAGLIVWMVFLYRSIALRLARYPEVCSTDAKAI